MEVHAEPASLWRRLLAFAIDSAVVLAFVGLFFVVATTIAGVHAPPTEFRGIDKAMVYIHAFEKVLRQVGALGLLLALLYATAFAVVWNGRTLGRRLLGIRLVDGSGLPPRPVRALLRSLLAVFSFAFFLGGFWLALFDRRGQTLHDKLTGTFVIRPSERGR
ncbi:MAG: RDD family protein [Myxococcaceae bacterium]